MASGTRVAALAVAIVAGLALIVTEVGPEPAEPGATLEQVWPAATVARLPGQLSDGSAYEPMLVLDPTTAVGTAPDRDAVRLVLLTAAGETELRRLPAEAHPRFGGFTTDGGVVAWAESTVDNDGRAAVELWALRPGQAPWRITADTGDPVFFNSTHDLVIAGGRLHWATTGSGPVTRVRSVPLSGGIPAVREVPGDWALSAWPWLVSTDSADRRLWNLDTSDSTAVPVRPDEVVACSPRWCRVLVPAGAAGGPAIDLMRPDGSERRRVVEGASAMAALVDVAVADRYEVYTVSGSGTAPLRQRRLLVHDLERRQSVTVATEVGQVRHHGGFLWWSTGDQESLQWHALDLTAL